MRSRPSFDFSFILSIYNSMFYRYASDGEEQTVLESMRDYLLSTIQKTFDVGIDQAECLYQELLQCTRNKNLVIQYKFIFYFFAILFYGSSLCFCY